MNFLELAKERYSCKSMDGRRVEKEKLDLILEAGRWAPTAKNLQGQRIYVVESRISGRGCWPTCQPRNS